MDQWMDGWMDVIKLFKSLLLATPTGAPILMFWSMVNW